MVTMAAMMKRLSVNVGEEQVNRLLLKVVGRRGVAVLKRTRRN